VQEGREILRRFRSSDPIAALKTVASGEMVTAAQASFSIVKVSDAVEQYIISIIEATRHDEKISLGVSPRGSIALMRAAQVNAILDNRDFVMPDDIKKVAVPVLAHRLILKGHAISSGTENAEAAICEILKRVPVPTEMVEVES
jgi:MoxR-like ATPase